MQKYRKISLLLITGMLLLPLISCRTQQRPAREDKPAIPEAISRGEGQEPRLIVYIVENQKKKEMAFEEYLRGVLAGEMQNDWPEEALQAQAILARTFVLEFITNKGGSKYEGAHVSTDIEEAQAWDAAGINQRIIDAINNTRGKVAVHNNQFIKAWFHAHAAGKTASAKEGLGLKEEEPPYIKVTFSPDSKEAPPEDVNWTAIYTKEEIVQAARKTGQEPGEFNSIEILEKGPSGRATKLKIGNAVVEAPEFRLAADSTKMKSTKIESITVEGNKVIIKGRGYGHGVGMSQWGAYGMAKEGKTPEEIIKHYFKDVEIVKLW